MSSATHGYDLSPNVKSRLDKYIKDMVTASGERNKGIALGSQVQLVYMSTSHSARRVAQGQPPVPVPVHPHALQVRKEDIETADPVRERVRV